MTDILIWGMCKLESGKSYRALFKELGGKFVVVVEQIESYADREVKIYPVEELPPHGDLVDATQYRDEFMNGVYNMCADDPDNNRANVIIDLYDCAPVVVPAERSGADA